MGLNDVDQWFQIPPEMNDFILEQVEKGMFGSKSDYWKYLIRELMLGNSIKAFGKKLKKKNGKLPKQ